MECHLGVRIRNDYERMGISYSLDLASNATAGFASSETNLKQERQSQLRTKMYASMIESHATDVNLNFEIHENCPKTLN